MSAVDREEAADESGSAKGKSIEDKRNGVTPNGSKRKRKDWRAFASENGGVRRRFLRSDMAKLLAETEAAKGSAANGAAAERLDLAQLDDKQTVNGKVKKESNECGVGSVTRDEVTDVCESEVLGNGELGAVERKESCFPSGDEGVQEGKGKGATEDPFATCVVSDKAGEGNMRCDDVKEVDVDASSENSEGGMKTESTNVKEEEHTDAEEGKTEDEKVVVLKEAKRKVFNGKTQTPVKVEHVMERRITRSAAAKQKVTDENVPKSGVVTTAVAGQMEEGSSGLDQADVDDNDNDNDNELLKNIKMKTNNEKTRSGRRESSDLTDSDEEFNPSKKRVAKEQVKVEADRDGSVSLGTKPEPSMERKKLNKQDSEEDVKVIKGSDSLGSRMERLRKRNKPKVSGEGSSSNNSDCLESEEEEAPAMKRARGRPPVVKQTSGKGKISNSKMTKNNNKKKKKKKKQASARNKKNVTEVESLSELDDKPRSEAKEIVRNMIKDLLAKHGWTIDMRPRNGREYMDQVHISPDGTTHWSITKAYYSFLREWELSQSESDGKSKEFEDFTPIPEDLLDLLKRTVCKERSDAGKTKKKKSKGKRKGSVKSLGVKSKTIKKKKNTLKRRTSKEEEEETSSDTNGRTRKKKKARLSLLARGSHKGGDAGGEDEYVPYEWKRTVLSWMIDLGVVYENSKIKYLNPTEPDSSAAEGKIGREGIQCDCCEKCFTVSEFGVHVGAENGSSCLSILYVEDTGHHFLQCLMQAWEKQCSISEPKGFFLSSDAKGADQNDDTCGVCGDGGDLVCCDKCPSTFHIGCLGMEMLPSGEWHCPYCSCAFCMKLSSSPLLYCHQCNDKFHSSCVSEKRGASVGQDEGISFCGANCQKLFEGLEAMLGVNHMIEGGFSWRLIRHITEDECSMEVRAECNSRIAVAMAVMDECFLPIDDQRSGVDLLQNVVYNCKSNFVRLNFRGFYTFLLERDDEIISVASVRVHGNKLAEMPFIGTRYMYRRQGMCRRLLDGIELALSSLKVEKLIIPAITELVDTWTNVFGFRTLEGSERQQLRSKSIVVFAHTGLLQKPMLLGTSSNEDHNISPTEGDEKTLEPPKNHQLSKDGMSPELPEFADASCADIKPDYSGEKSSYATASEDGDLADPSKNDDDVVQSVMSGNGKLCDKRAEVDSEPIQAVQAHENLDEMKSRIDVVNNAPEKTKVLNGADKIGPLGCEQNGRLQGCAENGVHHLAGPQTTSTDAVMASAAN